MAKIKQQELKKYDVFGSRVHKHPQFPTLWWEEFHVIGDVMAFNSVHAVVNAKKKFPLAASRIAVIAANHSSSPTSQQRLIRNMTHAYRYSNHPA